MLFLASSLLSLLYHSPRIILGMLQLKSEKFSMDQPPNSWASTTNSPEKEYSTSSKQTYIYSPSTTMNVWQDKIMVLSFSVSFITWSPYFFLQNSTANNSTGSTWCTASTARSQPVLYLVLILQVLTPHTHSFIYWPNYLRQELGDFNCKYIKWILKVCIISSLLLWLLITTMKKIFMIIFKLHYILFLFILKLQKIFFVLQLLKTKIYLASTKSEQNLHF